MGIKSAPKLSPLPKNWWLSGSAPQDYQAGLDRSRSHSGSQCASLLNAVNHPEPYGFATIMQMASAKNFVDQRVRMSAWLKTDSVQENASLWLSVYGTGGRLNISFDNMCDRKIVGTNDWKKYEIVLDVPADGTKLGYGVILSGVGQVWVDDFTFEIIDEEVDVTDCPCSEKRKKQEEDRLPLMPVNLSFDAS